MIKFKSIKWKNFLSTGDVFTELQLDRSPTTLIQGSNGSGKSTFLDAISFVLYGKPYRNIKKAQLVNSVNKKRTVVECEFETKGSKYKVIRTIKPDNFEVYKDGQMLNQDASSRDYQKTLEQGILEMSQKSFEQIVCIGSANYVPFMELKAADKRTVIEDLLGISIFSTMNDVAKERVKLSNVNVSKVETAINNINQQDAIYSSQIASQKAEQSRLMNRNDDEIRKVEAEIVQLSNEADNIRVKITEALKAGVKTEDYEEAQKELNTMFNKHGEITSRIKEINKTSSFFKDHTSCPTCNQELCDDHKGPIINDLNEQQLKLNEGSTILAKKIQKQNDIINKLKTSLAEISNLTNEQNNIENSLKNKRSTLESLTANKEDVLNSITQNIENSAKEREILAGKLKKAYDIQANVLKQLEAEKYIVHMLKDSGIKTKIIKQYLPIMNSTINKYLEALSLPLNFELDENFNETLRSRFRDDFSYANFSEGEKAKINLALLLTWREVASIKQSATTNILILDEVFDSSLDANAVDDLMRILNLLGKTHIYVISHRNAELQDKFRSQIEFVKQGEFSVMK